MAVVLNLILFVLLLLSTTVMGQSRDEALRAQAHARGLQQFYTSHAVLTMHTRGGTGRGRAWEESVRVNVTLGTRGPVSLTLWPHDELFSPDAVFVTIHANGPQIQRRDEMETRVFAGIVEGAGETTWARLVLPERRLWEEGRPLAFMEGVVQADDGVLYYIEPVHSYNPPQEERILLVYTGKDVLPHHGVCGMVGMGFENLYHAISTSQEKTNKPPSKRLTIMSLDVAITSDYGMYLSHGSGTQDRLEMLVNAVNGIYLNQLNFRIKVAYMNVIQDPTESERFFPDFSESGDISSSRTFLDYIVRHRYTGIDLGSPPPIPDWTPPTELVQTALLAHVTNQLFSLSDPSSVLLGMAYTQSVCTRAGAAFVTEGAQESNDNIVITTMAHEIGHVLGAQHDGQSSTIGGYGDYTPNVCASNEHTLPPCNTLTMDTGFIMGPAVSSSSLLDEFSSCSIEMIHACRDSRLDSCCADNQDPGCCRSPYSPGSTLHPQLTKCFFTETFDDPVITSIEPLKAGEGDLITVYGRNFLEEGGYRVQFTPTDTTVTPIQVTGVWRSSTIMTALVPEFSKAVTARVTVSMDGGRHYFGSEESSGAELEVEAPSESFFEEYKTYIIIGGCAVLVLLLLLCGCLRRGGRKRYQSAPPAAGASVPPPGNRPPVRQYQSQPPPPPMAFSPAPPHLAASVPPPATTYYYETAPSQSIPMGPIGPTAPADSPYAYGDRGP